MKAFHILCYNPHINLKFSTINILTFADGKNKIMLRRDKKLDHDQKIIPEPADTVSEILMILRVCMEHTCG